MNLADCFCRVGEILEKTVAQMSYEEIARIKQKYKLEKQNIDLKNYSNIKSLI